MRVLIPAARISEWTGLTLTLVALNAVAAATG